MLPAACQEKELPGISVGLLMFVPRAVNVGAPGAGRGVGAEGACLGKPPLSPVLHGACGKSLAGKRGFCAAAARS